MNTKPMTLSEKYEHDRRIRAEFRVKTQTVLVQGEHWQSCISCVHWNSKMNVCRYYEALPPPEVIVVGCGMYDFDIPF